MYRVWRACPSAFPLQRASQGWKPRQWRSTEGGLHAERLENKLRSIQQAGCTGIAGSPQFTTIQNCDNAGGRDLYHLYRRLKPVQPLLRSYGHRLGALMNDPPEGRCSSPPTCLPPSQAPSAALHGGVHWQQCRGLCVIPPGHFCGERIPQAPCGGQPRQHLAARTPQPLLCPTDLCRLLLFSRPRGPPLHQSLCLISLSFLLRPPDPLEAAWCSPGLGRTDGLFGV